MKILMMVSVFPPAPCGGAEKQCLAQSLALAARGHEVTVATEWLNRRHLREETSGGVRILRFGFLLPLYSAALKASQILERRSRRASGKKSASSPWLPSCEQPVSRWIRWMQWWQEWGFIAEVAWAVRTRRLQADVVHVHSSEWIAGFAHWVAEKLQVPVVCKEALLPVAMSQRDADSHVPWASAWRRRRTKCAFIAITDAIANALAEAGIPAQRIVKIPNGVNPPAQIAEPALQTDAVYIGNFTQGAAHKGFDVLLRAWGKALQMEPGMRLRLFGAGDAAPWKAYACEQGCGESVTFEGRTDQVASAHRRSGFLVLPSRKEGLSNALLEAMASGLPSVVSDIPGNVAVVRDGVEGLVVPAGDVEALAVAMVKLYRSPELRARMGLAARKTIEARFAISAVAEQLEAAYRRWPSV